MFHIKWLNYTDLAFSSRQTFFWLKRGGHRNPMLFNHFLTPIPAAHMALDGHRIRFLPPPRAHGSRRTPECFLSPLRYRGTGGVGHKNACLNKNVFHAPFPARTAFLSPPLQTWPSASSVGSETEKPFSLPKRYEYITFRLPPETEMRDL